MWNPDSLFTLVNPFLPEKGCVYPAFGGFPLCDNSSIRHYTDDGVSGTTFERSGFQAMIADMEAGRLGVIIVKDLSRLGREYIQSGQYMELIFPVYGVRFIAVNNGVDSDDPNTIEVTPLSS